MGVKKKGNPAWVKGVSGKDASIQKPADSPNIKNKLSLTQALEAARKYDILPLDFMLSELNRKGGSKIFKLDCAKSAAPYVHRKMPIAIDDGRGGPVSFATPEQLAQLPVKDLKLLQELMLKIAALPKSEAVVGIAIKEQGDEE